MILGIVTVWRFLFSLVCLRLPNKSSVVKYLYCTMFFARCQLRTYCQPIQCCPIPQQIFAHISLSICYLSTDNLCIPRWGGRVRVYTALDYVNVNKETRWLYHYSDSDVIEPIHCASRCWCLLEWRTDRLADPRMRDTTWGCKLGQWQRLFHCLNYTLDEQVTWQLPPITLYIPTIWESSLSLFGL